MKRKTSDGKGYIELRGSKRRDGKNAQHQVPEGIIKRKQKAVDTKVDKVKDEGEATMAWFKRATGAKNEEDLALEAAQRSDNTVREVPDSLWEKAKRAAGL